jgi:hypothetical protein
VRSVAQNPPGPIYRIAPFDGAFVHLEVGHRSALMVSSTGRRLRANFGGENSESALRGRDQERGGGGYPSGESYSSKGIREAD